jgi:hypothetical protein
VLAVRISCDPADSLAWRAKVAELSAWAKAQPVDTGLAIRRALGEFERFERADSGVGPTFFSDLIRSYYTEHGRFPRTAREAFPNGDPEMRLLPPEPFLNNPAGKPYRFVPHGNYFDVIDDGPPRRIWLHIKAKW